MLKGKEEFARHRDVEGPRMREQGTLGLETACAEAESLEGVTQVIHDGCSILGDWWQLHSSPAHEGIICYSKEFGL